MYNNYYHHYHLMGSPTYMGSVADRNVVMRRMTVQQQFGTAEMSPRAATLHAVSVLSCAHPENNDAASDASRLWQRTCGKLRKGVIQCTVTSQATHKQDKAM